MRRIEWLDANDQRDSVIRSFLADAAVAGTITHLREAVAVLAACFANWRRAKPANRQTLITEANALAARATSIAAGSSMSIPPGNESNPSFFPPAE
jgi:hypothetical protein